MKVAQGFGLFYFRKVRLPVYEKSGQHSPFQILNFAEFCSKFLVTSEILSESSTFPRDIGEISGKRKTKFGRFFKVILYTTLNILMRRVIMCLELTFNKKDKFLLYRLLVILLHFAAIVVVASFCNPHAISHTSAVLHHKSVFSPNNNWRWSTFCQTPQE